MGQSTPLPLNPKIRLLISSRLQAMFPGHYYPQPWFPPNCPSRATAFTESRGLRPCDPPRSNTPQEKKCSNWFFLRGSRHQTILPIFTFPRITQRFDTLLLSYLLRTAKSSITLPSSKKLCLGKLTSIGHTSKIYRINYCLTILTFLTRSRI